MSTVLPESDLTAPAQASDETPPLSDGCGKSAAAQDGGTQSMPSASPEEDEQEDPAHEGGFAGKSFAVREGETTGIYIWCPIEVSAAVPAQKTSPQQRACAFNESPAWGLPYRVLSV